MYYVHVLSVLEVFMYNSEHPENVVKIEAGRRKRHHFGKLDKQTFGPSYLKPKQKHDTIFRAVEFKFLEHLLDVQDYMET